jgi:hypothetical protein
LEYAGLQTQNVKVKDKTVSASKQYVMHAYRGWGVKLHTFFTSTLYGGEWAASRSDHCIFEEVLPGTHRRGGWVGPGENALKVNLYSSANGRLHI